jgi:dUTP pyrophosphatase
VLTAQQEHMIFHGQRVAQLLILPVPVIELVEVDELDETDRGSGGFGSTGT